VGTPPAENVGLRRGAASGRLPAVGAVLLLCALGAAISHLLLRQNDARRAYEEARADLHRGEYEAAANHLARYLKVQAHDRDALLLAARSARRADLPLEAERWLDVYERCHGKSSELALERTLLAAQQGQLRDRERMLTRMVEADHPDALLVLEALTRGYARTYRLSAAFRSAEALLKRQPDHAQALVWRGWALEHLKRTEEAVDDYARAVQVRPDDAWARLCLAEGLLNLQRYPEALEQFRWLRARHPTNPGVVLGVARCLRGVGAVAAARSLLDELAEAFPDEGLILSERGQLALEEGQPAQAEAWLRQAVSRIPYDHRTHYALYTCLQQQGRAAEARHHLKEHDRIDADQKRLTALEAEFTRSGAAADRRLEAAMLCRKLGQFDAAERHLRAALEEDPSHAPSRAALAKNPGSSQLGAALPPPDNPFEKSIRRGDR
jgi:tetratricopeptide (TPR) repeat protein